MSEQGARRDPRLERSFMAQYRKRDDTKAVWQLSPLKDVSLGGARFLGESVISVGDELDMRITLPVATERVEVIAIVAWAKPAGERLIEVGVTFHEMEPSTKALLERAVQHFLKRQENP